MKHIITLILLFTSAMASITSINSFSADFVQKITDDKAKVLTYKGSVIAKKPSYAKWEYREPVSKDIYIRDYTVTIVEPEIEQVIIKKVESSIDFFKLLKNAKKLDESRYKAKYRDREFIITTQESIISSIEYMDEFENSVAITFSNQKQNIEIEDVKFQAIYSPEFDIVVD